VTWTGYAIVNGLKPDIATYVTQRNPQSLEELFAGARVAELTLPPARDTTLHVKVDRLVESWEKLSTAQVQEPTRVSANTCVNTCGRLSFRVVD